MPIIVRSMCHKDIEQAIEIDSEAFPTILPSTNFLQELENKLSFYIVASDKNHADDKSNDEIAL